jgi:hypothetical protein
MLIYSWAFRRLKRTMKGNASCFANGVSLPISSDGASPQGFRLYLGSSIKPHEFSSPNFIIN